MNVIDTDGAASLRFFLTTNTAPGMDLRYDEEKVKSSWNFINKLWNASRFVLMNIEDIKEEDLSNLSITDKWILEKLNKTIIEVRYNMDKYEFNNVGTSLYNFVWNDFCDWYIEFSKTKMNNITKNVLLIVVKDILKMLHPLIPYVTEEIYSTLPKINESIMISEYPNVRELDYIKESGLVEHIIAFIKDVRKVKLDNNIGKEFYIETNNKIILDNRDLICKILKTEIKENNLKKEPILFMGDTIFICYDNSTNAKKEKETLLLEKEKLEISIQIREILLSNTNYTNKAPANIVENDKKLLEKEKLELGLINDKLK